MTQDEAAERLGVTSTTISYHRKRNPGLLPEVKGPKGRYLYTEDDLEKLRPILAKNKERKPQPPTGAEKHNVSHIPHENPFAGSPLGGMSDAFGGAQ